MLERKDDVEIFRLRVDLRALCIDLVKKKRGHRPFDEGGTECSNIYVLNCVML